VQQVNSELQEARLLIATFKRENEELIGNFETCKRQLIDTRTNYQRCQSELLEATERQVHTDAKAEAFREEVLVQIAEREEALRDLQQTFVPQDLDLIRVQLCEELEQPHRLKVEALEGDASKWETLFYNLRRVHEKERSEHELFKEQVKAAIDSDRTLFEAEVSGLHGQLEQLQDCASGLTLDEALLGVSGELAASQLREQELKAEVAALRRSLEACEALRLADGSSAVESLAKCEASLAHAHANLHAEARARSQADALKAAASLEASSLKEAASEKASELEKQRAEMAGREKELVEAEKRVQREGERRRHGLESEQRKLEEAARQACARAAAEEEGFKAVKRACEARAEASLEAEESARREGRRALEALRAELLKCQASEACAKADLKQQLQASLEAFRAAEEASGGVSAQRASSAKECELLRAKLVRLGEEVAAERREREHLAKKFDQASDGARKAEERVGLSEGRAVELLAAEQAQGAAVAHVQKEYASLVGQLDGQRRSQSKDLAALTEQHESERRASVVFARRQHDSLRCAAAHALDKEKKRTAKYKEAAQRAHETTKRAKEALQRRSKKSGVLPGSNNGGVAAGRRILRPPGGDGGSDDGASKSVDNGRAAAPTVALASSTAEAVPSGLGPEKENETTTRR